MSHLEKCVQKCFIDDHADLETVCVLSGEFIAEVKSAMHQLNLNVCEKFLTYLSQFF